jgi:hypothetical protein
MKPKVKGINLVPKEYLQAQKLRVYMLIGAGLLFLECILFVFTVVLPPIAKVKEVKLDLTLVQAKLNDPKFVEVNQTIEALNLAQEDVQNWANICKGLKKPNLISEELMDKLIARMPKSLTIDEMIVAVLPDGTGTTLAFSGRSETVEDIINYTGVMETLFKGASASFEFTDSDNVLDPYLTYKINVKTAPAPVAVPVAAPETTSSGLTATEEGGAQS